MFELVLDLCCENLSFVLELTSPDKNGLLNLFPLRLLQDIPNLTIRASVNKMMHMLYQTAPLKLAKTLSLYPIDFGIEFCMFVQSSFQSSTPKSDVVMYFIVYLTRLVKFSEKKYSKHKKELNKTVLYVLLSNDRPGCLTLLNVVGVVSILDFCDLYEFAARLHLIDTEYVNMIPRVVSEEISTVSFCAVCQSIRQYENRLRIVSANHDFIMMTKNHALNRHMLVTPRVFKCFHIYIMQKILNFVQIPIIYEMYLNLSLCMMKLKMNGKLSSEKISSLLIHALIDFRDQFINISHTESAECMARFHSIAHVLLSQDMRKTTRKTTHVQRLLIHISKNKNKTKQTVSLQKKCTYILRDCIIFDSETKQHMFYHTKSILSKLPCSAYFQYHHIIYNAVYKNIIMSDNSDSDMVHSENLAPLLFCITNCMRKQNCWNGKQMHKLIMKTISFISCSLYIWGNDDLIHKQHSVLWFLTMSFYNILLNVISAGIPIPSNFHNIFKSITQCVAQPDSLSLWTNNKLKVIFKIVCMYIYQKQYSHSDVVDIQRFMCNNQLEFVKPMALELKFIQLFYDLSLQWPLQLHSMRYMNDLLHQYPDENFISYTVSLIISNQIRLISQRHTTPYLDSVLPLYIAILENVHLKSCTSPSPLIQITALINICQTLCSFHFRTQHTDKYDNTFHIFVIDEVIIHLMQIAINEFDIITVELFIAIISLMCMWRIDPGRKQSVTWLYFIFSILSKGLLRPEFVNSDYFGIGYFNIMAIVTTKFPLLSKTSQIQHVCKYVQKQHLLDVHNVHSGVFMSQFVHSTMKINGYLC